MSERITVKYSTAGVKRLVRLILDSERLSLPALARASGMHFTSLYALLKRKETARSRQVRKSTIAALARAGGYAVKIDTEKNSITFSRNRPPKPVPNDIDALLQDIRSTLVRSGKKKLAQEERKKIIAVFRALVA